MHVPHTPYSHSVSTPIPALRNALAIVSFDATGISRPLDPNTTVNSSSVPSSIAGSALNISKW
jgi:hypothetical protein